MLPIFQDIIECKPMCHDIVGSTVNVGSTANVLDIQKVLPMFKNFVESAANVSGYGGK